MKFMLILAIETSCDETSVALVREGGQVLVNAISSQIDLHAKTGGIVPEVAAREQVKAMQPVLKEALATAGVELAEIDAIAVTRGPGLIGSLLVGVNAAKTLAYLLDKPLIPVNHLEGHIFSNYLDRNPAEIELPALVLIVSGGHNELVLMTAPGRYQLIGRTLDDAAGEAYDKTARLIGLGYPGGVYIQKAAEQGDAKTYEFPRAWLQPVQRGFRPKQITNFDFSFSGLKTAVWQVVRDQTISAKDQADLAASVQAAINQVLAEKTAAAATKYQVKTILLAGGVSANLDLRQRCLEAADLTPVLWPKTISYCTDNAAMIGAAAYFTSAENQDRDQQPLVHDWKRLETDPNLALSYQVDH